MKWELWLDDVRNPEIFAERLYHREFTCLLWARDTEQACYFVKTFGLPDFMALDHDLGLSYSGRGQTSMKFLRWLSRYSDDCPEYGIHSDNPEGAKNIESFMRSWKRSLE